MIGSIMEQFFLLMEYLFEGIKLTLKVSVLFIILIEQNVYTKRWEYNKNLRIRLKNSFVFLHYGKAISFVICDKMAKQL